MSDTTIARVHYFDRQVLRTHDFIDEQAYHVAMRRRHNIAHHSWGIVRGLELDKTNDKELFIGPGLAIDGYGRELILPWRETIAAQLFDEKASETLEIWLIYAPRESDPAPTDYRLCGADGWDALHRTQEQATLLILPPDRRFVLDPNEDIPARRRPPEVPPDDLDFSVTRTPPDTGDRVWPVYLGQVRRNKGAKIEYELLPLGRPYAGLVGEAISAPSGTTRVQLGADEANADRAFAVFLPQLATRTDAPPQLEIDAKGAIELRGDTTLYGNLTIDGGAVEFGVGPAYDRAMPGRIYRACVNDQRRVCGDPNNQASAGQQTSAEGSAPEQPGAVQQAASGNSGLVARLDELRIELAPLNSSDGPSQVVIGSWSAEKKKFVPCLTIDNKCNVTISGNLVVKGSIEGKSRITSGSENKSLPAAEAAAYQVGAQTSALGAVARARQSPMTDHVGSSRRTPPPAPSPVPEPIPALMMQLQAGTLREQFVTEVLQVPGMRELFSTALSQDREPSHGLPTSMVGHTAPASAIHNRGERGSEQEAAPAVAVPVAAAQPSQVDETETATPEDQEQTSATTSGQRRTRTSSTTPKSTTNTTTSGTTKRKRQRKADNSGTQGGENE